MVNQHATASMLIRCEAVKADTGKIGSCTGRSRDKKACNGIAVGCVVLETCMLAVTLLLLPLFKPEAM